MSSVPPSGGSNSTLSNPSLWTNPQILSALVPGIDISSIDQAMQSEINVDAIPLSTLAQQISATQTQLSAWQTVQTDLSNLQTAASTLGGTDLYNQVSATSSLSNAVGATADSSDATGHAGSYQVEVDSLMQVEIDNSAAQASSSDALNQSGTFSINGVSVNVSSTDSLADIADSINNAATGVTATVLPSGGQYVLNLASTDGSTVTWDDPSSILTNLGVLSGGTAANQIQAATPASYLINGVAETSTTNTDTTSIPGIDLTFNATTTAGSPAIVQVSQNQSGITNAVSTLANAYNKVLADMSKYAGKGGVLEGNAALSGVTSTLQQTLTLMNASEPDGYQSLAQIGVTLTAPVGSPSQLSLSVDTTALQAALTANPSAVADLFNNASGGIGTLLKTQLDAYVGTGGSLPTQISSLQSQISDMSTELNDPNSSINQRITMQEQALQNEFENMITALVASSGQGQQIQQYMDVQYGKTSSSG